MVAKRIEFGGTERLFSGHVEPVGQHLDANAHTGKVLGHCRNSIRFLHAQLRRIAHGQAGLTCGSEHSQNGNFINQSGCQCVFNQTAGDFPAPDVQVQVTANGDTVTLPTVIVGMVSTLG